MRIYQGRRVGNVGLVEVCDDGDHAPIKPYHHAEPVSWEWGAIEYRAFQLAQAILWHEFQSEPIMRLAPDFHDQVISKLTAPTFDLDSLTIVRWVDVWLDNYACGQVVLRGKPRLASR